MLLHVQMVWEGEAIRFGVLMSPDTSLAIYTGVAEGFID